MFRGVEFFTTVFVHFYREYVDLIVLTECVFSDDDNESQEPVVSADAARFVHLHLYFWLMLLYAIILCYNAMQQSR